MNDQLLDDNLENIASFNPEDLKEIKKARNEAHKLIGQVRGGKVLFLVLTSLTLLLLGLGAYQWYSGQESGLDFLIEGGFLFLIYASCALFYKKNPKVILMIGFGVYIFFFIVGVILSPDSIFSGMIMRIFVIYYFVKSIQGAIALPAALDTLKGLGVPSQWLDLAKNLKDLPLSKTLRR